LTPGVNVKTRQISLYLVVSAVMLCVQGCYHILATQQEILLEDAAQKFKQGDFAGAIRECSRVIELEPGDGLAYHSRGLAREALGDLAGALRDYARAVEIRPWDGSVLTSSVNAQIALLDSLQIPVPDTLVGDRVLLRMQIVTTRIRLSCDLDRLIHIDPEDTWARGERGMMRFELGDSQGAIEDFTDVLDMEYDVDWAYYNRGLAEASLGDYPAAIRDFTRVLRSDGTDGWAFYQRGLARIHAGDHDGGCSDLDQARGLGVGESENAIEELCQ
jgi:tetratricopeptide (TPR) repeat protein